MINYKDPFNNTNKYAIKNKVTKILLLLSFLQQTFPEKNETNPKRDELNHEKSGIYWKDLGVAIKKSKEKHEAKSLLEKCSGFVANGQVCGIIGPSGAGKSTLLSALAGTTSSTLSLTGSVWYTSSSSLYFETNNSTFLSIGNGDIAFLQQNDVFFNQLTIQETLDIAYSLQQFQPQKNTNKKQELFSILLNSLNLNSIKHTYTKKLSGGERRRLSVALEMLSKPKLFIADECTTGLDSFQALKVVRLISKLSKQYNIPCLCTLHQPQASIWKELDFILLLAAPAGRVCYFGKKIEAVTYFQNLGFHCPPETNPAEYLIDLVSIDTEDSIQCKKDLDRIHYLSQEFCKHQNLISFPKHLIDKQISSKKVNILQRWKVLLERALLQNLRNTNTNIIQLLASVGQAFLFSYIFPGVKSGPPTPMSIADRMALLSFSVINMAMFAFMKPLNLFGLEKPILSREQLHEQYTGFDYLVTKAVAEIPLDTLYAAAFASILKVNTGLRSSFKDLIQIFGLLTISGASIGFAIGSFASNVDMALAMGVPTMVILLVVGVINPSGVSSSHEKPNIFIRFLKSISPIKWAIEAICLTEFRGMQFKRGKWGRIIDFPRMGAFAMVQNGNQVLEAIGLQNSSYHEILKNLLLLSGVNLLLSLVGLEFFGKPKFVQARDLLLMTHKDFNDENEKNHENQEPVIISSNAKVLGVSSITVNMARGLSN